jgi:hypothetical protein
MYKKGVLVIIAALVLFTCTFAQEKKKQAESYKDFKSKLSSHNPGDLLTEARALKTRWIKFRKR